ncbi:hypothetical protein NP233_g7102 [Leucocoprinus birnbaumii]|uniref:Uncharacterized protein n=1 Tax=Leucocoprinus birnbaumii TaxID=56174 RepID=A0AAD5YV29_9AGAR|nr:hypothetical protein NP233_g7102 [Leucocoprinus birnbaumii]
MFSKFASAVATALTIAGIASAAPASENQAIEERDSAPGLNIQLCFSDDFGNCINVPVGGTGPCINLVGGLSGLNNEVSGAKIPLGTFCTFYDNFSCLTSATPESDGDSVTLQGGNYSSFASLPDDYGVNVDFDNRVSSFRCSPLIWYVLLTYSGPLVPNGDSIPKLPSQPYLKLLTAA